MTYPLYTPTGNPRENLFGVSELVREEFRRVERGIDEADKYPVVVYVPNVDDDQIHHLRVPWPCTIARFCAVNMDTIDATYSSVISIQNNAGNTLNLDPNGFQTGITPSKPPGTIVCADVKQDSNNVFVAGDKVSVYAWAAGGATAVRLNVTLQLNRTG